MKQWVVTIKDMETFKMEIEADSMEEAIKKGHLALETEAGRGQHHSVFEWKDEAHEL